MPQFLRRAVPALLGFAGLVALSILPASAQGEPPVIAAAANLEFTVTEIAAAFAEDTGQQVRLSMGSTGNFARQIRQGAPFELFLAADDTTIPGLAADGFTEGEAKVYAVGRLALVVPEGAVLAADGTLADLKAALEAGRVTRFSIANPEHAPFGVAAREALQHEGMWDAIQPFLVMGENVSQAAQFALSGNAEGGLIAYSLALAPDLAARGESALVPDDWHEPLRQSMALLKGAGPVAHAFHAYMSSPRAVEILERYGYSVPAQ